MLRLVLFAGPLLAAAIAAAVAPPVATLDRLDEAVKLLESESFSGSYTLTTRSLVAKPGGKDPEQTEMVLAVSRKPGQEADQQLVRASRNGQDMTEELRAENAAAEAKRRSEENGEENGEVSVSLDVPSGADLARYRFSPIQSAGGTLTATFEPLDRQAEGAVTGRLAWDPATLDPLWVELEPVEMPKHVKRMSTRIEVAHCAERLCPGRTVMEGVGGFLFVKREFRVEMTVSDVTFDPP